MSADDDGRVSQNADNPMNHVGFVLVTLEVTVVVFPSLLIDAAAFTGADKSITIRTYGTGASVLVTQRASCKLAAFA